MAASSIAKRKPRERVQPGVLVGAQDPHFAERREMAQQVGYQLEAVFSAIIESTLQMRGEVDGPSFDPELLPDVIRALAIRGAALNSVSLEVNGDIGPIQECVRRSFTHG